MKFLKMDKGQVYLVSVLCFLSLLAGIAIGIYAFRDFDGLEGAATSGYDGVDLEVLMAVLDSHIDQLDLLIAAAIKDLSGCHETIADAQEILRELRTCATTDGISASTVAWLKDHGVDATTADVVIIINNVASLVENTTAVSEAHMMRLHRLLHSQDTAMMLVKSMVDVSDPLGQAAGRSASYTLSPETLDDLRPEDDPIADQIKVLLAMYDNAKRTAGDYVMVSEEQDQTILDIMQRYLDQPDSLTTGDLYKMQVVVQYLRDNQKVLSLTGKVLMDVLSEMIMMFERQAG